MSYQIIATLGPASATAETWQALLEAGASGFRLNTSHNDLAQIQEWLERLDAFRSLNEHSFAVTLDLQGSKWRLGRFPNFELIAGQRVELIQAAESQQPGILPVPHADFFQAAVDSDGEIVLNDARSTLAIESSAGGRLVARVTVGGMISANKGITFRECEYRKEMLNEKDLTIVLQTGGLGWVDYAVSYIRDAAEMRNYRALLGGQAKLAAKLERRLAVAEAAQVAEAADSLWLCRGDLGAELGLPGMAQAAWRFSEQVRELPRPSFLAGQVLEHMTLHPTPTRAEVCGLYDALRAGYSGFVLSDETAVGQNPVLAVQAAAMFEAQSPRPVE